MRVASFHRNLLVLLGTLALAALPAMAQEGGSAGAGASKITFKVPLRGAPKMRVGGGVRSIDSLDVALSVLAPEESGLTTSSSPTLYWYLSETVTDPVEIAVTDITSLQAAAEPLIEVSLPAPVASGIHGFDLSERAVALKAGVEYQWIVAVVRDPEQRSKDVIAGGTVIYTAASDELRDRLSQHGQTQPAVVLAEAGIWYDAVDALSRRIAQNPGDRESRNLRAQLLEQVGLSEAAAYDRGS